MQYILQARQAHMAPFEPSTLAAAYYVPGSQGQRRTHRPLGRCRYVDHLLRQQCFVSHASSPCIMQHRKRCTQLGSHLCAQLLTCVCRWSCPCALKCKRTTPLMITVSRRLEGVNISCPESATGVHHGVQAPAEVRLEHERGEGAAPVGGPPS